MGAVTRAAEEEGAVAGAALGVALTVAIALPGVMAVLWQPAAVSSGIPGVIAYINGVNLRQLVSVPTGLATALGRLTRPPCEVVMRGLSTRPPHKAAVRGRRTRPPCEAA